MISVNQRYRRVNILFENLILGGALWQWGGYITCPRYPWFDWRALRRDNGRCERIVLPVPKSGNYWPLNAKSVR